MPPPKVNNIRKTIKKKKSILRLNKSFWRMFALAVSLPSQVPVAHSEGHTFVSHHLALVSANADLRREQGWLH